MISETTAAINSSVEASQRMVQRKPQWREYLSAIQRYGLAVLCVSVALGLALFADYYKIHDVEAPLFLFAIALTAWHAGFGPAVLAFVLSSTAFNYYFTQPLYTLYVTSSDLPYYIVFLLFAALVAWFSAVRRRVERNLRQSRDDLEDEITQRRALNEELTKRSSELEAINKELEAFAYSVSHALRAPIRHIAGFTELLQKNAAPVLNERSQRHARMILESAKRMGNLIDDLLAFSRTGRAETKKTEVDLEQLVKEAVAEIGQDTKGRDIAWKIGALPVCYGDRSMLRLVVINLVSNAVKLDRMRTPAEIEIGCVERNKKEV